MYFSLHKRLLFSLLLVLSLLWLLIAIWLYLEAEHEVEELFDVNLTQTSSVLLTLIPYIKTAHDHNKTQFNTQTLTQQILDKDSMGELGLFVKFLIHDGNKNIISQSQDIPSQVINAPSGLVDYNIFGKKWRVYTLYIASSDLYIRTTEPYVHRNNLLLEILFTVLMPLLLGFVIMSTLVWFVVNQSLSSLKHITHDIAKRDPNYLKPVTKQNIPIEIKPLLDALNKLFRRLEGAFENERRFTADAAHELRTPLAGIKIQTTVASRAVDEQQRQQALDNINTGVDRATHLVEQLLILARVDTQEKLAMQHFDIIALCIQLISDFTAIAHKKNIDLGLETHYDRHEILANADALAILLRNLIDNAIRYTPENGKITVIIEIQSQNILLAVEDNGIGIKKEQQQQMLERFKRGNHINIKGSGLGLSIVQRIVKLHQCQLLLEKGKNGQGLRVSVILKKIKT